MLYRTLAIYTCVQLYLACSRSSWNRRFVAYNIDAWLPTPCPVNFMCFSRIDLDILERNHKVCTTSEFHIMEASDTFTPLTKR